MRPPFCSIMAGRAWRLHSMVPVTFTSNMRRHSSAGTASSGARTMMPALLTRTSSRPKRVRVAATSALTSSSRATSPRRATASAPNRSASATTASAPARLPR
jgi:hypothetical protein